MCKRWMGGMLLAAWLGLTVSADAQSLPDAPGPGRMPEPAPAGPGPAPAPAPGGPSCPDLVPGPISPLCAPQGPKDDLSLDCNHKNAFMCDDTVGDCGRFYANLGAMALQRQRLGAGAIGVVDPTDRFTAPSGGVIALGQPLAMRYNDLTPPMTWGPRAVFGVLDGHQAVEATVWYIFQNAKSDDLEIPGRIDTLFHNPPRGFRGENGLFQQADRLTTTMNTSLFNAEVNYRGCQPWMNGLEILLGVRYLFIRDTLDINTTEDVTDPRLNSANYGVLANNRLLTGQVGFEYNCFLCPWLSLGLTGKVALGADFIRTDVSLTRGDGYIGFNSPKNNTRFSQIYEVSGFIDFHIVDRFRIRGGYMTLWAVDVATSVDQVDFDLHGSPAQGRTLGQQGNYIRNIPHGRDATDGSLFFHGPMVEAQFLF